MREATGKDGVIFHELLHILPFRFRPAKQMGIANNSIITVLIVFALSVHCFLQQCTNHNLFFLRVAPYTAPRVEETAKVHT